MHRATNTCTLTVSLNTTLLNRKSSFAGTYRDSYCAKGRDKKDKGITRHSLITRCQIV